MVVVAMSGWPYQCRRRRRCTAVTDTHRDAVTHLLRAHRLADLPGDTPDASHVCDTPGPPCIRTLAQNVQRTEGDGAASARTPLESAIADGRAQSRKETPWTEPRRTQPKHLREQRVPDDERANKDQHQRSKAKPHDCRCATQNRTRARRQTVRVSQRNPASQRNRAVV